MFISFCILLFFSSRSSAQIVSLDPAATELIYELGLDAHLVARDASSNYPLKVSKLPIISRHTQVNREALVKIKPEYIIAHDLGFTNIPKNISVIFLQNKTLDDYQINIKKIASLYPKSKKFNVESIRRRLKLADKTFVLYLDDSKQMVVGKDSFITEGLERCGLTNAIKLKGYPRISREDRFRQKPDYTFILEKKYGMDPDLFSRLSRRFFVAINQFCQNLN